MSLKWENECQAVISLGSRVTAMHWRQYVNQEWDELTKGITGGEFRLMVMAGVHGKPNGEVGSEQAENLQDVKNQAVIILCENFRVMPPRPRDSG